jgi:hypothetical protein
MLKAGKMNEIADEMLKTQLKIIALQELRWTESGKSIKLNIHSITAVTQKKQVNLEPDLWFEKCDAEKVSGWKWEKLKEGWIELHNEKIQQLFR